MAVIATHTLQPGHPDSDQIYNALDCAVTMEVWEALQPMFNTTPSTYTFERALQAPALEMMLRGFAVDQLARDRAVRKLDADIARLQHNLNLMAQAVWSKPLNPRSGDQLKSFFYQHMKIPEIASSIKGESKLRMNRETLEKVEVYFHARPIVATILAMRDAYKQRETFTTLIDPDGRMRTSINVGATETGRFSSSKSTTGTGMNMFNVSGDLRSPFVADPGWKLCGIDLEQAESREVGRICGEKFDDWRYLDACEGGDLHSTVAKMVWKNLQWPSDPKALREMAEQPFYRHFSRRDMSKRLGHASNYMTTPYTASRNIKCPIKLCQDFQEDYYAAFPLAKWHQWVAEQIQTTQQLTTVFGRQRHFFGRPNDDATLREAIAYDPQSSTADRLNIGLLRMWNHFGSRIQVLLQLYDAIYFQFREDDNEAEIVQEALRLIDVPLDIRGRHFTVPGEAKTGWNWANFTESNPDGLKKWKGEDTRRRQSLLDRKM